MSHSYRHPMTSQPSVPVATVPMSGRIVPPVCSTVPPTHPAVYPVMPISYGMLPAQHQQCIPQSVYSSTNTQSRVPFVAGIPPVPNMYVPMSPVPIGLSPSVPDPTKLFEEQRKLEKERNFHMQQERLKHFTVAGKKGNMSADNLIDSMLGKLQPKKSINLLSAPFVKSCEVKEEKFSVSSASKDTSLNSKPLLVTQENTTNIPAVSKINPVSLPCKKDPKELDSMMFACSNLNTPSKAKNIFKPPVKEIVSLFKNETKFKESEKARDWHNVQGLDDVFVAPKPRFPLWCQKSQIPDFFKRIEAAVTNNNQHPPDTNLLFPVLMASGLSCGSLGQLWELVNENASGQLTIEEMYAMLALIAVAQSGYPIKSIDILHQFPSCPVPSFNSQSNPPVPAEPTPANVSSNESNSSSVTSSVPLSHQLPDHTVIRPTALLLGNSSEAKTDITEDVAAWNPFADSDKIADDDFDDFKSATPTAINFSMNTPTSTALSLEDDFDEFKQASCVQNPEIKAFPSEPASKLDNLSKPLNITAPEDLMSPEEDKYSVFRSLQQKDESTEWGGFSFTPSLDPLPTKSSVKKSSMSVSVTKNTDAFDGQKQKSAVKEGAFNDDEFGDFMHANPTFVETSASITDFADFSNFKQPESNLVSVHLDDEFGDFTSSVPVHLKADLGPELMFHHLKDNISLAESQSVSSLELGTFDGGGGHSGESKSSLSRQGSIPSLDLKSVGGIDGVDSEECSTDLHLSPFVSRNFKSPSPSSNTKGSDENESTSVGLPFQSSFPLVDKYSVIRQEKGKEEDLHVSCWIRCLQSCTNILLSTKRIFNQMSCSSVCNEVLSSEEGGNYIKNVTEVYKVVCRIKVTSKFLGKQTQAITDLLNEAEMVWNTICGFFADSPLMPEDEVLDFSYGILKPEPENNPKACGLCLLSVSSHQKSCKQELCPSLSYGGKNYHSPCANFWVNCVDPLLPALTLPQLL